MKIFVIESPSPDDQLEGINEAESILSMSKMFGHKAAAFFVKSEVELLSTIKYLSDIDVKSSDLYCYHFSCHGNDEGLLFGTDFLTWKEFTTALIPIFEKKELMGRFLISISACGANQQKLTSNIKILDPVSKPSYVFVCDDDQVKWRDALLNWTILYHRLVKIKDTEPSSVKKLMKAIQSLGVSGLIYFRLADDEKRYLKFASKKPELVSH